MKSQKSSLLFFQKALNYTSEWTVFTLPMDQPKTRSPPKPPDYLFLWFPNPLPFLNSLLYQTAEWNYDLCLATQITGKPFQTNCNFFYLSHPSFCRHRRRFHSHSYYSHHNHQSHHILCNGEKERSHHITAQNSQSNAHTTLNFAVFGHPALCKQPLQTVKPGFLNIVQKYISFYVTQTETCKRKDLILMKIAPLLLMFILNNKPCFGILQVSFR